MHNLKLTSGLLGLALTIVTVQAAAPALSYEVTGNNLILTYTGTLLQSADAVNWSEVALATSPYKIALSDKKLFFCAKDAASKDITIPLSDTVDLDLIWIEPGTFMMGSPEEELGRDLSKYYSMYCNETQHQVTLTQGYWLGKYEVTQAQYVAIMEKNPSAGRGPDLPVEMITRIDAMNFCAKLTAMERGVGHLPEGYEYTLPTEAQWEYACRAGTTTAFNNGTNIPTEEQVWDEPCPNLDEVGWYRYNSGKTTHPVGQKQPNAWGLYDMHGNVWEFCLDCDAKDYPASPVTDPVVSAGKNSIIRGGGFDKQALGCRSAIRCVTTDSFSYSFHYALGFRVALTPVE